MTTSPTDRVTLNRDQLAALLAHHADVIAARWRESPGRGAWVAASALDSHAADLTADEETPAVRELLDSMLSFEAEHHTASSALASQPSIRDTMGPADGQQKMRLLDRLYASTTPVDGPVDRDLLWRLFDEVDKHLGCMPSVAVTLKRSIEGVIRAHDAPPAPADRAAVLREAADFVGNDDDCDCGGCDTCVPNKLAAGLRRLADEAQQTAAPARRRCTGQMPPIWTETDPVMVAIARAAWEGCTTDGYSTVADDPRNIAAATAAAARAAVRRELAAPAPAKETDRG
ncbi:hypothetical protein [Streptomyces longispororuber]|uniref:hypothetical protein n=1 Tax=Streptomyces longispororuber TaxID=68230 RepID=UPI0036F75FA0